MLTVDSRYMRSRCSEKGGYYADFGSFMYATVGSFTKRLQIQMCLHFVRKTKRQHSLKESQIISF